MARDLMGNVRSASPAPQAQPRLWHRTTASDHFFSPISFSMTCQPSIHTMATYFVFLALLSEFDSL